MKSKKVLKADLKGCLTVKFDAAVCKGANRIHGNRICLRIENNRLITLLENNMACFIEDKNGISNPGIIRDIQYKNGSATVCCDLGQTIQ
jgi:hypothetical protein